jgi:type II secretory pathway predicted ATPase ExeA
VRAATSQLDATAHHIIYVATPTFGARGLYLTIVHALGAKPRAQKADLIAQTRTLLAAEEHERRRRVVVIIDVAHLLAHDQLEELRLLNNAEMDSQSPPNHSTGKPLFHVIRTTRISCPYSAGRLRRRRTRAGTAVA